MLSFIGWSIQLILHVVLVIISVVLSVMSSYHYHLFSSSHPKYTSSNVPKDSNPFLMHFGIRLILSSGVGLEFECCHLELCQQFGSMQSIPLTCLLLSHTLCVLLLCKWQLCLLKVCGEMLLIISFWSTWLFSFKAPFSLTTNIVLLIALNKRKPHIRITRYSQPSLWHLCMQCSLQYWFTKCITVCHRECKHTYQGM